MTRIKYKSIIALSLLLISGCSENSSQLQLKVLDLLKEFPGEIGVAVACGKDTVSINADVHFPMFSVVKFPQALAVADKADLDAKVRVCPEELKPGTWSPMREKYPDGGLFSVRQIVEYALIESDNNASDILFNKFSSPEGVEYYLHSHGINGCSVKWNEESQHEDPQRCYDNWITPDAALHLLCKFYESHDTDETMDPIWATMSKCNTGSGRIPKYISDKTQAIVHKTGTGFVHEDGTVTGINDIGCIVLPDGSHFELAVFVKDAKCDVSECEELIASIARICYDLMSSK